MIRFSGNSLSSCEMEEPSRNPFADFLRTNFSGLLAAVNDVKQAALASLTPPPARAASASVSVRNSREVPRQLSESDLDERLAGVPVYALSNGSDEFVLISGREGKEKGSSLGLLCLGKEDAEVLLQQMRSMDPVMRSGSRIVPLALNKVTESFVQCRPWIRLAALGFAASLRWM